MSDTKKYLEMFEYLRTPDLPQEAYGNFVFGRADPRLVHKMGELYVDRLAKYFLITGGIGKDSGPLGALGIPEAHYLGSRAVDAGLPADLLHLETEATNGGQNARHGLAMISDRGLDHDRLTVVSHATSLRRLAATLEHEAAKADAGVEHIYRVPTNYPFDPADLVDQQEAIGEFNRLADYPAMDFIVAQPDLPANLVDFARDKSK